MGEVLAHSVGEPPRGLRVSSDETLQRLSAHCGKHVQKQLLVVRMLVCVVEQPRCRGGVALPRLLRKLSGALVWRQGCGPADFVEQLDESLQRAARVGGPVRRFAHRLPERPGRQADLAGERDAPFRRPRADSTEAEDVARGGRLAVCATQQLRSDEAVGADWLRGACQAGGRLTARTTDQAPVRQHPAIDALQSQDVHRRDVAMDEALRVRGRQRVCDVAKDVAQRLVRQVVS